jgi:glycosyltransferase involved in cell wall biosynthesis
MRKILVYRSELLPLSETFIREQILSYRRWKAVLIGLHSAGSLPLDGLDVRVLRPARPGYLNRLQWRLSRAQRSVPQSIIQLLKQESASLLHAHFGPDAVEAWPIARALGLPMVATLHGYDININRAWWESGRGGRGMQSYPERLLALGQESGVRFIAVSEAIRRSAIAFGLPECKVSVRYIGVDPARFKPGGRPIFERERRVLFVGRLVEKKGCEYLIRAFKGVQQTVPDASLVIVGDGELRSDMVQLAQDLGVRAQFRGACSHDEVRKELDLARAFCLPSVATMIGDAEGLPIVLLEAQASGVPVVTSARGGAGEAVSESITGFCFPERRSDILADRLIVLLTDNRLAESAAKAGPLHIADKFDIHKCTQSLEDLYDEVARERLSFKVPQSRVS